MVSDAMSNIVLTVGPDHTLRDAATKMAERGLARRSSSIPMGTARA